MDKIRPNYSVNVNFGGTELLVDRVFDNIHLFKWLGHGILKVICDDGLVQIHTSESEALRVAEAAGIIPVERDEISQSEYNTYLSAQETQLDKWFDME